MRPCRARPRPRSAAPRSSTRSSRPAASAIRRRRSERSRRRRPSRRRDRPGRHPGQQRGSAWFGPSDELDTATYDRLFDGNVRSAYLLTAALAPAMARNGRGVDHQCVEHGRHGGAVRRGRLQRDQSRPRCDDPFWAAEYGANGVRVNAVAPGPVFTPRYEGADDLGKTTLLTAPPNPRRSPKRSRSWSHRGPATSPARPSLSTAAAPPCNSDAPVPTQTGKRS